MKLLALTLGLSLFSVQAAKADPIVIAPSSLGGTQTSELKQERLSEQNVLGSWKHIASADRWDMSKRNITFEFKKEVFPAGQLAATEKERLSLYFRKVESDHVVDKKFASTRVGVVTQVEFTQDGVDGKKMKGFIYEKNGEITRDSLDEINNPALALQSCRIYTLVEIPVYLLCGKFKNAFHDNIFTVYINEENKKLAEQKVKSLLNLEFDSFQNIQDRIEDK